MAEFFNAKYGAGSVEVSCHDVYYNMLSVIEDGHMDVVERAKKAMEKVGGDACDQSHPGRYRRSRPFL
jgi:tripeptide aminopeptidase